MYLWTANRYRYEFEYQRDFEINASELSTGSARITDAVAAGISFVEKTINGIADIFTGGTESAIDMMYGGTQINAQQEAAQQVAESVNESQQQVAETIDSADEAAEATADQAQAETAEALLTTIPTELTQEQFEDLLQSGNVFGAVDDPNVGHLFIVEANGFKYVYRYRPSDGSRILRGISPDSVDNRTAFIRAGNFAGNASDTGLFDVQERYKTLDADELEELVRIGGAFQRNNFIGVPVLNEHGHIRLVIYDYTPAYTRSIFSFYSLVSPVYATVNAYPYVPSSASFNETIPFSGQGAFGVDLAAEVRALHFQEGVLWAGLVVSVVLVPIGAGEAITIATAYGFSGTTGVVIFGVGEITSQAAGVPLPFNAAGVLSSKVALRSLTRSQAGKAATLLDDGVKLVDDIPAPNSAVDDIAGQLTGPGQRLAGQIDEIVQSGLTGATRLTPSELATGRRLERLLGKRFRESPHVGAEYIDDLGRSYDAIGHPNPSKFWNAQEFFDSIDGHLLKSNYRTVIDASNFSPSQIAQVRAHLSGLTQAQLDTIIRIGF